MKNSALVHTHVFLRLAILATSAGMMLWLLWRFPLATGIATVAVLGALVVSAHLAQSGDGEGNPDLDPHESGLHTH